MLNGTQLKLEDVDEKYKAFVEKFKPKKTTDDCYTPDNIYEAIKNWAIKEYHLEGRDIVRPFWPGGDYERENYPRNCVVIDNPPFSIISQIVKTYTINCIDFFLFAPYLTNFGSGIMSCTHLITGSNITYENGADVPTAFLTNLDNVLLRADPELAMIIKEENDKNTKEKRKNNKYKYPDEVCTASMLGYMASHGIKYTAGFNECFFIRALDAQITKGKAIFGGGFLLSEKAAAEKAAAEKAAAEKAAPEILTLSDSEKKIIKNLGTSKGGKHGHAE